MTPTLFDALPPCAAKADPHTSHEAACDLTRSGARESQSREVAELVKRTPGLSSYELSKRHGMGRHVVARRLPDAERMGLVRRGPAKCCAVTGHKALSWYSTEE